MGSDLTCGVNTRQETLQHRLLEMPEAYQSPDGTEEINGAKSCSCQADTDSPGHGLFGIKGSCEGDGDSGESSAKEN